MKKRISAVAALTAAAGLVLSGCASGDPMSEPDGTGTTIVVGSAAFPESEILAYVYAEALRASGIEVEVRPSIGARDAYIAALEDGSIDLVPEYTGNLLQYFDSAGTAQSSEEVYTALTEAVPDGLSVLDQAEAADADSYNVTRAFSEEYGVTSLADLAQVPIALRVAANPEFAERPYGIPGLLEVYGVEATLVPINDGGGPNTLKALLDGDVELADIYSTTPSIAANDLVTLDDPESMILAQNVVPLIDTSVLSDEVAAAINAVQGALTTEDLIAMNTRSSGDEKASAEQIAADWVAASGLFG